MLLFELEDIFDRSVIDALFSCLQNKEQSVPGDLLVKKKNEDTVVSATDKYNGRVSIAANLSLLLADAKLSDQHTFTCMVLSGADIKEYPVNLVIQSEYKHCAFGFKVFSNNSKMLLMS